METCSGRGARIVWNTVVTRSRPRLQLGSVLYSASHITQHTIWRKLGFRWACVNCFSLVESFSCLRCPSYMYRDQITPLWSLWLALDGYLGSHCCLYSVCTACPLSIVNLWVLFGNSWYVAVRMIIQHCEFLIQKYCFLLLV